MLRISRTLLCAPLLLVFGCDERGDSPLSPGTSNIDRTPPEVVSTLPAFGSTQVLLSAPITVTFSEPMLAASISRETITFNPPITGPVSVAGNTATVIPLGPLAANTIYIGTVTAEAADAAHNQLRRAFVWSFTTGVPPLAAR
jgi:hypothetical protein